MSNIAKVKEIVEQSAIYVTEDSEGIRITCIVEEEAMFIGIGEESGADYQIAFSEVNLKEDLFYKLVLVEF